MIRFFKKDPWSLASLTPPWAQLPSIYQQIRSGILDPLPDEDIVFEPSKIRWVDGARDGILGGRAEGGTAQQRVFAIIAAVHELQQRAHDDSLRVLYELVIKDSIVSYVDALLQDLSQDSPNDCSKLIEIGRYFAIRAAHREAVKFGLALVGAFGTTGDLEIARTLGKHEEFTLFGAIAAARLSPDPENELWELAKNVTGWGRIQIVRRLDETQNPEIQAWMLRGGFRNTIMNEYLACICARAGRLHEALNYQFVDTELLDAAGDIILALTRGGPAEGIDDYEHSADVCESYLNIVWSRKDLGLRHFLTVRELNSFLHQRDGWNDRLAHGWSRSRRDNMQPLVNDVLVRDIWRELAAFALASDDEQTFYHGNQAAEALGIDTWEIHFARVKASPITSTSWYGLMKQSDETRIGQVLEFAESSLPLSSIETGPADLLGLGPEFQPHGVLDYILQDLRRFPRHGWRFIRAGLRSPVVRNRNMAIQALAAWPLDYWDSNMRTFVERARDAEPCDDVRGRLGNLLTGAPIS